MKTSWEWVAEFHKRLNAKVTANRFAEQRDAVLAGVIREAVEEATGEVIQAMRHVETLTPGYVQQMMEAPDGHS